MSRNAGIRQKKSKNAAHLQDAALIQFLTESVPDYALILLDREGRVLTWNNGAELIKGYKSDEIIGQSFTCFYPTQDIQSRRPLALLARALQIGRHEETGPRMRKDGTQFQANVVIVPRYDRKGNHIGFGKLTRDVTARVEAAARERRLLKFVEVIRDTMIDGLIVIDAAGTIQVLNPAAQRMFGYSNDETVGSKLSLLIPDIAKHDLKRTGQEGGGVAPEVNARRKNGTCFPARLAVGETQFDDEQIFVGVVHDLTAQKAIENDLRQAQRLDAIGHLTGGIAHDFNNIITVINGIVDDMLADNEKGSVVHEQADRIGAAAQRARDLTGQLLAFARKQPLKPQPLDLNAIVTDTVRMLGRTLGEKIEIDVKLDPALWIAHADRSQLEVALINLCVNARDAMPHGGRLVIETGNVTLGDEGQSVRPSAPQGKYVTLAVHDTGQGIPPEALERVFDPFFTTKDPGKGTGLGLSMVYGFAKQSGGHVTITSEVERGTTVRLYLQKSTACTDNHSAIGDNADEQRLAR